MTSEVNYMNVGSRCSDHDYFYDCVYVYFVVRLSCMCSGLLFAFYLFFCMFILLCFFFFFFFVECTNVVNKWFGNDCDNNGYQGRRGWFFKLGCVNETFSM